VDEGPQQHGFIYALRLSLPVVITLILHSHLSSKTDKIGPIEPTVLEGSASPQLKQNKHEKFEHNTDFKQNSKTISLLHIFLFYIFTNIKRIMIIITLLFLGGGDEFALKCRLRVGTTLCTTMSDITSKFSVVFMFVVVDTDYIRRKYYAPKFLCLFSITTKPKAKQISTWQLPSYIIFNKSTTLTKLQSLAKSVTINSLWTYKQVALV